MYKRTFEVSPSFALSIVLLFLVTFSSSNVFASYYYRSTTIADVIADANGFDVLEFALEEAGLTHVLANRHERFTVFAPTNEAFQNLADELTGGDVLLLATALVKAGLLDDVLTYHVVDGAKSSRKILTAGELETLSGQTVKTGIDNNGLFVQGINNMTPSVIVSKPFGARNGRIYPIDQVLININPADL